MVDVLHTSLTHLQGSNACPTVTVTPETVKAAFTKEGDVFAQQGVTYLVPARQLRRPQLLVQAAVRRAGDRMLGLSEEENRRAVEVGFRELLAYEADIQRRAREVLDQLEREKRIGIVVLARPYHHDPGLNHEILEEFQKLGYPVFSQSTLPLDEDLLERLFGDEVRAGAIRESARHPGRLEEQLLGEHEPQGLGGEVHGAASESRRAGALELQVRARRADLLGGRRRSSRSPGTPYFSFKDIDENKPSGSIKIRVETIHYFLKRYIEDMQKRPVSAADIDRQLAEYERKLREELLREAELATLAEQHQELAAEMKLSRRFLPIVNTRRVAGHEPGRVTWIRSRRRTRSASSLRTSRWWSAHRDRCVSVCGRRSAAIEGDDSSRVQNVRGDARSTDQLTSELRDYLEVAYVSLADYVDEECVTLLREYGRAGEELAADRRLAREKVCDRCVAPALRTEPSRRCSSRGRSARTLTVSARSFDRGSTAWQQQVPREAQTKRIAMSTTYPRAASHRSDQGYGRRLLPPATARSCPNRRFRESRSY